MAITELEARHAKPDNKTYRIKDDNGLYLEIRPTGTKIWRMRYWIDTRERILTFGEYPLFSVKEARAKRDEARRLIAEKIDPADKHKDEELQIKIEERAREVNNFGAIAEQWLAFKKDEPHSDKHKQVTEWRMRKYILPTLASRQIDEITSGDLLSIGESIQAAGHVDTAHRVMTILSAIFRYAKIKGRAASNPTEDLHGVLQTNKAVHFASIQKKEDLGGFYYSIGSYTGSDTVVNALRFTVLCFPRPKELRYMEWDEIDFNDALWRIPGEKMKMGRPHLVPLATQTLALLEDMKKISNVGKYVFASPATYTGNKPMSDVTLVSAMRNLGYEQSEVCAHGFRHTASTMLNESGLWRADAIERQLAHDDKDSIRGTYNAAEYIVERREMMQWYADFLDTLKESAKARVTHNREI